MVPASASVIPIFQMYNAFTSCATSVCLAAMIRPFADSGVICSTPCSAFRFRSGFSRASSMASRPASMRPGWSMAPRAFMCIFRVVLPQVRPGLIAAFIFNLIFVWNEFLINFVMGGTSHADDSLCAGCGHGQAPAATSTGASSLHCLSYVIMPTVMIFFFQKYLLVGMTFGTVRGEV